MAVYHHLTTIERGKIELMLNQGYKVPAIAAEVGYHATTIRREIKRNRTAAGYDALQAQERYTRRRKACRRKGKLACKPLRDAVIKAIGEKGLSPELAAGRLRIAYPDNPAMHICHEPIYQAIYNNRHLLDFLFEFLVQAHSRRRKRG